MSKISFDHSVSFIDNLKMNGVTFEDYNEAATFVASSSPKTVLDMLANSSLDDENMTIRMDEGRFEELSDMAGGSKITRRILSTIYIVASTLIMWFLDQQRRQYTLGRAELLEPGLVNSLLNWTARDPVAIRAEIAGINNAFAVLIVAYVISLLYALLAQMFNIVTNETALQAAGIMFPAGVAASFPSAAGVPIAAAINRALASGPVSSYAKLSDKARLEELETERIQDEEAKRIREEAKRIREETDRDNKARAEEAKRKIGSMSRVTSFGGLKRKTKAARKTKSRHSTKRHRK